LIWKLSPFTIIDYLYTLQNVVQDLNTKLTL